jgi:hypothetical protein
MWSTSDKMLFRAHVEDFNKSLTWARLSEIEAADRAVSMVWGLTRKSWNPKWDIG